MEMRERGLHHVVGCVLHEVKKGRASLSLGVGAHLGFRI